MRSDLNTGFMLNFSKARLSIFLIVFLLFIVTLVFKPQNTQEELRQSLTLSSAKFTNINESLPPIKNKNEIYGLSAEYTEEDRLRDICVDFNACTAPDPWIQVYERQVKEYGELATRFLFSDEIYWIETLDYDKDGQEELAIALCGVWGNYCPHKIIIVEGDRIIASTE